MSHFPAQKDVASIEGWSELSEDIDHGSNTPELVHMVDLTLDDPNVIARFNDTKTTVSDEVLTDVTAMQWTVPLGQTWEFEYLLSWDRTGTCLLEFALDLGTGVKVFAMFQSAYDEVTTPAGWVQKFDSGTGTLNNVMPIITTGTFTDLPARIYGVAIGDTAAGTIDLQISKGDANATSVALNVNSFMIARKILG